MASRCAFATLAPVYTSCASKIAYAYVHVMHARVGEGRLAQLRLGSQQSTASVLMSFRTYMNKMLGSSPLTT